jgi:hypothetical protein
VFGHEWQAGEATIVDRRAKKTTGDGMVTVYEYIADVRVSGQEPFRTIVQEPGIATDFWSPSIGQVVQVKADVKRQKAKFDKDDPSLSSKARRATRDEQFAAEASAPPLEDS